MPLEKLDHVNVRTAQLDAMIDWYTKILGMQQGDRPDFPFGGAWMYIGDAPTVHLVDVKGDPGAGSEINLKLEHFAFFATDASAFETKLKSLGEKYRRSELPNGDLVQYNVWDPDGNHIHVDFSTGE